MLKGMRPQTPILLLLLAQVLVAGPGAPTGLRCEYLTDPMGMDVAAPRFYWILEHTERGQRQTAYQVLVSRQPAVTAGDEWDSGKTASPDSAHVAYAGRPLQSGVTYYWKVRYWDSEDAPSPYSRVARFDTGLLNAADWKAKWIGGANQLRKEFRLPARPVRARAYVTGLGYYELRVNGHKAGRNVLDPGWTKFDKRVFYSTYDVTSLLRSGDNAVGLMLGEGWWQEKPRAGILQLNIELPGGQKVEVVTDQSWKAAAGPILSDSIYNGETYDARKETPGWDQPGFDAAAWKSATLREPPKGVLSAQMLPPVQVIQDIPALVMTSPRPGTYVYDMGQNFSGWMRLRVKGPRGTAVRLRHSELLYDDGTLNVENLRAARATDVYILRGGEEEVWEPRFTWHGFRYVELTGYPGTPTLDTLTGRVVHTAVKPAGGFACSKPILNQVQRLIQWGIKTNLFSVPTDCTQRDERMGWMADAHLYGETAMLNFDMAAFYTSFLRNIHDNQDADGSVPDTVPRARFAVGPADPSWGSAYPLFVLYAWQQYGDRRILEQHYEGIKAWAGFLRSKSEDGVVNFVKYGDWVPAGSKTPGNLVSSFYYHWSVRIVAQVAEILGKKEDAEAYHKLAQEIAAAFHRKFYDKETGVYGNGSQTSNILPLFGGIAPKETAGKTLSNLRNHIVYETDSHLTTGIIGTKYLLPLLTERGAVDLAYDLAVQTSYPSWGFMVQNGATTLWELWQNKTGPSMNSHNHPMFGSVGAWYLNTLAGINFVEKEPGYRRVLIRPQPARDLKWASGSVDTVRGRVACSWSRTPDSLQMDVVIPVGSTAEVHVPKLGIPDARLSESGRAVQAVKDTPRAFIVECGGGAWRFQVSAGQPDAQ